jgi:hypothetical protein
LNPGEQSDGADESVLYPENQLANARPAFDDLSFFFDGGERHLELSDRIQNADSKMKIAERRRIEGEWMLVQSCFLHSAFFILH